MPALLIVCNWKMYFFYKQAHTWLSTHQSDLVQLTKQTNKHVILCPSYDALGEIAKLLDAKTIALGAQDCAAHINGPYTGQVSAQSLKELGCSYVLIGHSETRGAHKGTIEASVLKATCALEQNLTPIVCIGESEEKYKAGTSLKFIEEQVRPILELSKRYSGQQFIIAYEPIWSIGTSIVPKNAYIESVFTYIISRAKKIGLQRAPLLLYGGSVDEVSAPTLKQVVHLGGFLIGKASTDFQKLKKIVQLV
ncbi:MAG: triose-phosphate isomerase [Candidatus Babeliales bacterium]